MSIDVFNQKYSIVLISLERYVRDAGGVCIADEVQVGFGRVGTKFWAFELQGEDVVPDIVTLGILASVMPYSSPKIMLFWCRKAHGQWLPSRRRGHYERDSGQFCCYWNGIFQYGGFETLHFKRSLASKLTFGFTVQYGGNPVSCAVANAVLDIIEEEKLMDNARIVGQHLLDGVGRLKEKHSLIGDVRGVGMFIGIDLVTDRKTREPATAEAQHIITRLKQERILFSADGPNRNVLKFKPPMVFSLEDADHLLAMLAAIFDEIDAAK